MTRHAAPVAAYAATRAPRRPPGPALNAAEDRAGPSPAWSSG
jgi:hypothetical protein